MQSTKAFGLILVVLGIMLVGHCYAQLSLGSSMTLTLRLGGGSGTVLYGIGSGQMTPLSFGAHSFPEGTSVTLFAQPSSGYVFGHWTVPLGTFNTAIVTVYMGDNAVATVYFTGGTAPPTWSTVTITKTGQGTISPSEGTYTTTYHVGDSISLSASAASGWRYELTKRNGAEWTRANPAEIANLGATETVEVVFVLADAPVTPPNQSNNPLLSTEMLAGIGLIGSGTIAFLIPRKQH